MKQQDAVVCFLDRLVTQRGTGHVAVPDSMSFDEAERDRLVRVLSGTRYLHASLLWRSIAATLG